MPRGRIPEDSRQVESQGSTGVILGSRQPFQDADQRSRISAALEEKRETEGGGIGGGGELGDEEFFQDENYFHEVTSGWQTTGDPSLAGSISSMLKDPMIQLFGIVFILFLLTAILATINFCIWYLERRRRRIPLHWRSSPGVDVASSRPITQTPKRSFHIQHALYKTVRRPSAMPP